VTYQIKQIYKEGLPFPIMEKSGGKIIEVVNISKKFRGVVALDKISFSVEKNTIFGLLGSNGAGKTTILHIITGLLDSSDGDVYIFGEKTKRYSKALKRRIAIVPQKISLYEDLTIFENLYFFAKMYGLRRKEILEKIEYFKKILKLGNIKRKIKHLSGGYQRRTSFAVSLIGNPEVIILDEALVGIDLETKKIIIDLLRELKKTKTVIITTHSIREAESLCDHICILHKGKKVLDGETKKIIEDYASSKNIEIEIKFRDSDLARKTANKFKEKDIKLKVKENILCLEFSPKNYYIIDILEFLKKIQKERDSIEDIEINKPGLEEVMLDFIKQ